MALDKRLDRPNNGQVAIVGLVNCLLFQIRIELFRHQAQFPLSLPPLFMGCFDSLKCPEQSFKIGKLYSV